MELAARRRADTPEAAGGWAYRTHDASPPTEALAALKEAIPLLEAAGERRKAAEALVYLALRSGSGPSGSGPVLAEALALLDGDEPSPELAFVL